MGRAAPPGTGAPRGDRVQHASARLGASTDDPPDVPDTLVGAGLAARIALTDRMGLELTWAESLKDIPAPEDHDLQDSGLYFRFTARFP